ncbi:hypothetical protein [Variovorax sp. PAMC 28711]|uniref:hypothetical protein n=1 Tax=Variovorax sp. PAMC 28711 TaxID=1795631 RepID=UPI0012E84D09|nr:hypothetical protein [Variovorax sp. PAMC 28711]
MTAPTAKQVNDAERGLAALARAGEDAQETPAKSEVHTYADGTQVVGAPPFPAKSPRELQADEARGMSPMAVPMGMKQSGENVSDIVAASSARTPEQVKFDAEQQLTADVLSGKDPHTPNPTTSSDKPILAGTGNVITAGDVETPMNPEPTAEDLARIAKAIEPNGDIEATDEQKEGAAVQIVRETKGAVVVDKTSKKK